MSESSEHEVTPRGFAVYAEFTDSYGSVIRVQESSSAEGAHAWIFAEYPDATAHLTLEECRKLMEAGFVLEELAAKIEPSPHLNVAQARQLRDALNVFIAEAEAEERS